MRAATKKILLVLGPLSRSAHKICGNIIAKMLRTTFWRGQTSHSSPSRHGPVQQACWRWPTMRSPGSRAKSVHMPVSKTTPGRLGARVIAPIRVAFRHRNDLGTQDEGTFAAEWLGLCAPLSTLRRCPHGHLRMTRGRCGSLLLHRDGLAPSTPCRSSRRTPIYPDQRTYSESVRTSQKCQATSITDGGSVSGDRKLKRERPAARTRSPTAAHHRLRQSIGRSRGPCPCRWASDRDCAANTCHHLE
jgi:hypothetical protein